MRYLTVRPVDSVCVPELPHLFAEQTLARLSLWPLCRKLAGPRAHEEACRCFAGVAQHLLDQATGHVEHRGVLESSNGKEGDEGQAVHRKTRQTEHEDQSE
jgi:hypothetical protein